MFRLLFRSITSQTHRSQHLANFCTRKYAGTLIENASSSSKEKSHVISYLVNSCGLSPEKAVSASKKLHFISTDKPNAVLSFLEKRGFTKTQISDIVKRYPQILVSNPEKTILPKIESCLQITGISEADVFVIYSKYPTFLSRSLENRLAPVFVYLKDIIGPTKVETLLKRGSWVFNIDLENRVIPNVDYLRKLGVPQSSIELSLYNCPDIFWSKPDEFREIVEEVKQMGFDPSKSTFVLAIHARTGKGNIASWDQCHKIYSKWGWSKDDICRAFKLHPNCMLMSEKKITQILDFLVNNVGREARLVAQCPYILFYNVEKRIIPRCTIAHQLFLKGLMKKNWSLSSVLCPTEENFLEKYVTRYAEELPELHDTYLSMKARVVQV